MNTTQTWCSVKVWCRTKAIRKTRSKQAGLIYALQQDKFKVGGDNCFSVVKNLLLLVVVVVIIVLLLHIIAASIIIIIIIIITMLVDNILGVL